MIEIPLHLAHKPLCVLPYENFDGLDPTNSDAKYISIGLAQWDNTEVSIKVLRHSGDKWSRQSEELPLHRPIDMTILLALALFGQTTLIPPHRLHNQTRPIDLECIEQSPFDLKRLSDFHHKRKEEAEFLKKRLNALLKVLEELKKNGQI